MLVLVVVEEGEVLGRLDGVRLHCLYQMDRGNLLEAKELQPIVGSTLAQENV